MYLQGGWMILVGDVSPLIVGNKISTQRKKNIKLRHDPNLQNLPRAHSASLCNNLFYPKYLKCFFVVKQTCLDLKLGRVNFILEEEN